MSKLILPNTYVEDKDIDYPLIFLAGPIRGAPNWHSEAIKTLFYKNPNTTIVSPSRTLDAELRQYLLNGDNSRFNRQRPWELHYLELAAKGKNGGSIMFWLPGEETHRCEKSYGAMTRIELGETFCKHNQDNKYRFGIGSDGKFSELDTVAYDLKHFCPDKQDYLKIIDRNTLVCKCPTLEETCDEAIRIANSK
jgi:hypothetical protein